jgi:ketosteroid isomerase-like protein
MKALLLATVVAWALGGSASAQTANSSDVLEQEIRRLEMRDAAAVLRGDFATMETSWAEDLIVNSNNQITRGRESILKRIRAGDIGTYSTFVREIESVAIHRDAAIVMGLETVTSTSNTRLTGDAVRRRYMNVWTKRGGEWLLTARQATVVCQN